VHPLWQSNIIPLLFLLTAITMGYAMVVFESLYASVNLHRPLETALLSKVSAVIPWLLISYMALRVGDLLVTGDIGYLFRSGGAPYLFAIEMALFLYAVIKLLDKQERVRPTVLFRAALAVLIGGALYRFNAFLIAFDPGAGWHYFPAVGEMMITIGIIAFEIMAYLFFVKKTPVMLARTDERAAGKASARHAGGHLPPTLTSA
jgi:Ni/Fe-hydrogenase subunit HybB-like protein